MRRTRWDVARPSTGARCGWVSVVEPVTNGRLIFGVLGPNVEVRRLIETCPALRLTFGERA